ncbi:MAG: hypothetical protein NTY64_09285 [Deltaproteobacteria bacterium]|nr:hypothetical protein [Deltaproteobacteria bacterium]
MQRRRWTFYEAIKLSEAGSEINPLSPKEYALLPKPPRVTPDEWNSTPGLDVDLADWRNIRITIYCKDPTVWITRGILAGIPSGFMNDESAKRISILADRDL